MNTTLFYETSLGQAHVQLTFSLIWLYVRLIQNSTKSVQIKVGSGLLQIDQAHKIKHGTIPRHLLEKIKPKK